jgi:trimethylamine--corrinoid protein Co-methyltransferase
MHLRVLKEEDIQRIHTASLQVLEEQGLWFRDCPEARELLESHGCRAEGDRVRFPRSLVEECLTRLPKREWTHLSLPAFGVGEGVPLAKGETHYALIGNAYYLYDYAQGASRGCETSDIDDKCLLVNQLDNFEFDFCDLITQSERDGQPGLFDFETSEACMFFLRPFVEKRAGKHLRNPFLGSFKRRVEERKLEALGLMILEHVKGSDAIALQGAEYFVWCNPISPLQYHPEKARRILEVAQADPATATILISPAIGAGATGPVTLAGVLVQANAEILGGVALAQLAGPGTLVIYGCVSSPMDLRNAELSQGHLEAGLLNAASVQLADHYGMPSRIAPGNPSAKEPGPRAVAETAMGLLLGAAAGPNLITTGLLNSLLTISFEHLVVVDELINQVQSARRDLRTDPDSLAVETILTCGHPSPTFLYDDHTLRLMNRDVYYSDFNGRVEKAYQDWYEKAHWRVQRILEEKPVEEEIDKEIHERLAAVEARLKEDPDSWKRSTPDWWRFYTQDFE